MSNFLNNFFLYHTSRLLKKKSQVTVHPLRVIHHDLSIKLCFESSKARNSDAPSDADLNLKKPRGYVKQKKLHQRLVSRFISFASSYRFLDLDWSYGLRACYPSRY